MEENNSNGVPMLDPTDPDFKHKLDFELQSTQSSSDYRNDRDRPYNGQPWTDDGIRGKTEVKGVTFRDLRDCLIKAMLQASPPENEYFTKDFEKCWDYSTDPPKPTQFLLDMQAKGKYISTKADCGNWRPQDVYKLDWNNLDPIAICQNFSTNVEKMMGIFPNISDELKNAKIEDILP